MVAVVFMCCPAKSKQIDQDVQRIHKNLIEIEIEIEIGIGIEIEIKIVYHIPICKKQQTTNNKQQTTNNKQQTTNNKHLDLT